MNQDQLKQMAAEAALKYIKEDFTVGVGTGTTTNFFIDALASMKGKIEGAVASSIATEERLKSHGIPVYDLNASPRVDVYIDGTDEVNDKLQLIKGGGGAHTREKIVATVAKQFICIADQSKQVTLLGKNAPLPLEVHPMARSYVAREIIKLGASPEYRPDFLTDNGNIILDIYNLRIQDAITLEMTLKSITGVVESGLFAKRPADILLLATDSGVNELINEGRLPT